ncbi:hypothetical protein D3C72_1096990 [compost metagenome]
MPPLAAVTIGVTGTVAAGVAPSCWEVPGAAARSLCSVEAAPGATAATAGAAGTSPGSGARFSVTTTGAASMPATSSRTWPRMPSGQSAV